MKPQGSNLCGHVRRRVGSILVGGILHAVTGCLLTIADVGSLSKASLALNVTAAQSPP